MGLFLIANTLFINAECAGFWSEAIFHRPAKAHFVQLMESQFLTGPSDYIALFMTFDRMFMMVSLPLSQRRRNFLLHIIVSFTIGIGLMIPQFFAFKTEEVECYHPLTPAYDLTCYDPWVPNLQEVKYFWVPYTIVWLIFVHILPKVGIVVMNIVIILRLKKIFARPSLQENRPQSELANASTTNIPKKELRSVKSGDKTSTPKNISRTKTKTSLVTVPEEISTVSQVVTQREVTGKKDKKERRKKNEEKMTRLLITIMISFTLLTSPSCIYAIIDFNYNKDGDRSLQPLPLVQLLPQLLPLLLCQQRFPGRPSPAVVVLDEKNEHGLVLPLWIPFSSV